MARVRAFGRRGSRARGDRVRTGSSHPRLSACSSHRFPAASAAAAETRIRSPGTARPWVADHAAFSRDQ
jgi:hypothetical protein